METESGLDQASTLRTWRTFGWTKRSEALQRLFAGACCNVRCHWHDPGDFLYDRSDWCLRFMCCAYWKPTICHGQFLTRPLL